MAERVTAEERTEYLFRLALDFGVPSQTQAVMSDDDFRTAIRTEIKAAEAQARREGLEAACRKMCPFCEQDVSATKSCLNNSYWHDPICVDCPFEYCKASPIRALLAAEGGEK